MFNQMATTNHMKRFSEFLNKPKVQSLGESYTIAPTAQQLGIKMKGGFAFHPSVVEEEEQEDVVPVIKLKKQRRDTD